MFILPYIHSEVTTSLNQVNAFKILTVGGTALWSEETVKTTKQVVSTLLSNGIHVKHTPVKVQNVFLCEVDNEKTAMDEFYTWKDIGVEDVETFCWRTFYTFGKEDNYMSWLPIPEKERVGVYSCQELVEMIYKKKTQKTTVAKSSKP